MEYFGHQLQTGSTLVSLKPICFGADLIWLSESITVFEDRLSIWFTV